jgi:phosphate acyltransferase
MIAVDAMGGDFAPEEVLRGVLRCAKSTDIDICLFGPDRELQERLTSLDPLWRSYRISIVDAQEIIGMGEEPVVAVRRKRMSSLVMAVESVANGQCDVVVSAGNSGAVMAASLFLIKMEEGIDRPALVGLIPAMNRPVICLDLGANTDCKAEHLFQFAHLGARYASGVHGIVNPSIGLLSNGEEPTKGSLVTKEVFAKLKGSSLNFIGNVEPYHILQNKADVVVCDGFAGNIFLKTLEAVAGFCCSIMERENKELLRKRLSLDKEAGALLLGIKKPVVVVHGNASAEVIERAILFAHKNVFKGVLC